MANLLKQNMISGWGLAIIHRMRHAVVLDSDAQEFDPASRRIRGDASFCAEAAYKMDISS
jgi:hypothetical protein